MFSLFVQLSVSDNHFMAAVHEVVVSEHPDVPVQMFLAEDRQGRRSGQLF